MTEQITVPRATWDAMLEALDAIISAHPVSTSLRQTDAVIAAREALTAANAVSEQPEIVAIEGMPTGLGNEPEILAQWDEVKAAAEGEWGRRQWHSVGAWLYEGGAIAVISDHFPDATKMVQPQAQADVSLTEDADMLTIAYMDGFDAGKKSAQSQATEPAWMPIETAPKDGSEILLGHPDGSMAVGHWTKKRPMPGWTDGDDFAMTWPTHWMPIPAAPEVK